jgi:hypothetical protein
MSLFLTVPFKFLDHSWAWLQDFVGPIVSDYQKNAPAVSALVKLKDQDYAALVQSSAWQELDQFLRSYGIDNGYPQLFIYKQLDQPRSSSLGNPHLDTVGGDGTETDVPIRFNILLVGDDDTEMVWWDCDRCSDFIVNEKFLNPLGQHMGRLQVKGSTPAERWALLGEPVLRKTDLAKKQESASFVRTDRLHALNWTGANPRVILSVRSTKPWPFNDPASSTSQH